MDQLFKSCLTPFVLFGVASCLVFVLLGAALIYTCIIGPAIAVRWVWIKILQLLGRLPNKFRKSAKSGIRN